MQTPKVTKALALGTVITRFTSDLTNFWREISTSQNN